MIWRNIPDMNGHAQEYEMRSPTTIHKSAYQTFNVDQKLVCCVDLFLWSMGVLRDVCGIPL